MRLRVTAVVALALLAGTGVPAAAEGLFDLFMRGAAPAAVEAPREAGTLTVHRRQVRPRRPRVARAAQDSHADPKDARHKAEIAIDPAKVADWYLRDRTLRRGDIVVLRSGALVYKGRGGETRRPADFARLGEARFLPARTRAFVAKATAANATSAAVVAPPKPKVPPGPNARAAASG